MDEIARTQQGSRSLQHCTFPVLLPSSVDAGTRWAEVEVEGQMQEVLEAGGRSVSLVEAGSRSRLLEVGGRGAELVEAGGREVEVEV